MTLTTRRRRPDEIIVTAYCPYCAFTATRPGTRPYGDDPHGMTRQLVFLHVRAEHPAPRPPPAALHCPSRRCDWWTWAANPGELADHLAHNPSHADQE